MSWYRRTGFSTMPCLWAANFLLALMKNTKRLGGSELQKKIASSTGFEGKHTENGRCLPVHVVFVSLTGSSGKKMIQNRKLLKFWRVFVDLNTCDWKSRACQGEFVRHENHSWYRHFQFVHHVQLNVTMPGEIQRFVGRSVKIRATKW